MVKRSIAAISLTIIIGLPGCKAEGTSSAPLDNLAPVSTYTPPPAPPAKNGTVAVAAAPPSSPVVARLNGNPITMDRIVAPLIEGYGLNVLLRMVQLDYVKQEVARANQTVTADDIARERDRTLAILFPDAEKSEYAQLLQQLLEKEKRGTSPAEFNLVIETNAYLRKLAEPMLAGKIDDAALDTAFRHLYGEKAQIRHIQLTNMVEVAEAKRRLAAGESFAKVAESMSKNARTAALGGELPPFTRSEPSMPQVMKDAAFSTELKEGEVSSNPISYQGSLHLIKLDARIAPTAVKFEDVKQSLREDITEKAVQSAIAQLRTRSAQDMMSSLVIDHPVLKQQLESSLQQRNDQIKNRAQINEQMEKERARALESASTQPATIFPAIPAIPDPTPAPAAPGVARPPATQSGVAPAGVPDGNPVSVPTN